MQKLRNLFFIFCLVGCKNNDLCIYFEKQVTTVSRWSLKEEKIHFKFKVKFNLREKFSSLKYEERELKTIRLTI